MGTIIFKDNVEHAINELCIQNQIEKRSKILFEICIEEKEKLKMKSKDFLYFPYSVATDRLLEEKDVIHLLSGPRNTFPLWIDMSLIRYDNSEMIIQLKCSCRFRKSAELQNQDKGYPPFRVL